MASYILGELAIKPPKPVFTVVSRATFKKDYPQLVAERKSVDTATTSQKKLTTVEKGKGKVVQG